MQQVLIDGYAYRLVTGVKYQRKNKVPTHTLEDGYDAADHIFINPPSFVLDLILFEGEYDRLQTLSQEQRLISIVVPQGAYSNVVIESFTDTTNKTANTRTASVALAVQRITSSETRPTELDGIALSSADTTGTTTSAIVAHPEDVTVNRLMEYYLSKLSPIEAISERIKLNGMETAELWTYLVETQEYVYLHDPLGPMGAINYDAAEDYRKAIDILFPEYSAPLYLTTTFTYTDTRGVPVSYDLSARLENADLGGYTFAVAFMLKWPIEVYYHVMIARRSDGKIVYNGPVSDLTPFTMKDPDTGITIAVLQYSKFMGRLYIS